MVRNVFFAVGFLVSAVLALLVGNLVDMSKVSAFAHPPFMAAVFSAVLWACGFFLSITGKLD